MDDFSVTHTICAPCVAAGKHQSDPSPQTRKIQEFLHSVSRSDRSAPRTAGELIAQGSALGIAPVDLLFGILQPALYEVGERWARCEMSVSQEHQFTSLVSAVVQHFAEHEPVILRTRQQQPTQVLLVMSDGNYHSVGVQIAELLLLAKGIAARAIVPGLPASEVLAAVRSVRPLVLGISVATPDHLHSALEAAKLVLETPGLQPLEVVLGGSAIRRGLAIPAGLAVRTCHDIQDLLPLLEHRSSAEPHAQSRAGQPPPRTAT